MLALDQEARQSREWATQKVARLPSRWANRLVSAWERARVGDVPIEQFPNAVLLNAQTNQAHRETADSLAMVITPLDATDDEICQTADKWAKKCQDVARLYQCAPESRAALAKLLKARGVEPPDCKKHRPALLRMTCPQWWRRALRKAHAKAVEGAAIKLGYVHRKADPYCSDETLARRLQQNARNAAAMEATTLTNEHGQEFTLAELAAKGVANKAIRRGELMTRIAGFERIAQASGHAGVFLTVTCPSRMHKWRTIRGNHGHVIKVDENPRYDGTLPDAAQKYLAGVWAKARSKLHREGVKPYGFRIAEPNHDGTPHWHMLVFVDAGRVDDFCAIVKAAALKDSPDERGAHNHRVDIRHMDAAKGTAAGYIAKYVAKNIDGYRLEKDLLGNDALETSARVEAWATTWRIRQFQQIGGAPVTPWRELRRVKELPAGAPAHLVMAFDAVNRVADIEAGTVKSVAWDRYTTAQGGVTCGRNYRIKIMHEDSDDWTKYDEPAAPKPVGLITTSVETYTPDHMKHLGVKVPRVVEWTLNSVRYAWQIVKRTAQSAGRFLKGKGEAFAPWTCVNNCSPDSGENSKNERQDDGKTRTRTPDTPEEADYRRGAGGLGQGTSPYPGDGGGLCPAFA